MKRLEIETFFDTCYLGENRINNRFSFVDGVVGCIASCPENRVYLDFDESRVTQEELEEIFSQMEFPIYSTKIKAI